MAKVRSGNDDAVSHGPVHVRRREEIPKAILAAGVLIGTSHVAHKEVPETERRLFVQINQLPNWIGPVLWAPMQLGSLSGPFISGAIAWRRFRRWRPAVGAVAAGVLSWQLAKIVKDLVDRGRPLDEVIDVIVRSGTPLDGLGFVSGHSAVAFSLATVMSPYVTRPWRWGFYLLAGVVSFSRIHVSAHLPLDTVGGASLGCVVGWLWHVAVGVPDDVPGLAQRWRPANADRAVAAVLASLVGAGR